MINSRFRSYWGPVILFAVFIFALSSVPRPPILGDWEINDKYKHALLFGAFAATLWRALSQTRFSGTALLAPLTVLFTSLYGATDEFHQLFVPGRSSDWRDWAADTVGAILICAALAWVRVRRRTAVS